MKTLTLEDFFRIAEPICSKLENKKDFAGASQLLDFREHTKNQLIEIFDSSKEWTPKVAEEGISNWVEIELEKLEQVNPINLRPVLLNGKTLDLRDLADYMDDELRESVNDSSYADNQEYIELYIKRARKEDPGFIEILNSEFNVNI